MSTHHERRSKAINHAYSTLAAPLAVIALTLPATLLWATPAPPCSHDIAFHLLRSVQLESLLRQGVLYSRWLPDMALRYGYPLFNFYAPLSYYPVAILSLAGLPIQTALAVAFALSIVASGLGAYCLARDYFPSHAALVAAVAYAYAPYLAYDAFFRGNLAETMGWAFPPLALWAIGKLALAGGRRYLAGAALAYAAMLLTHNVFALIYSPLLIAYGLMVALIPPSALSRPRRLALVCGALLLGLGLACFFWLPALVERAYVHSDRLLVAPDFAYWSNFIRLRELLAPPQVIHPDLMNPSPPRALGLIHLLLGLPALNGLWLFHDWKRRLHTAFFAVALVAYSWMTTASSRVIWDALPLLAYVQFPWRLLGPAALCVSMLIAATVNLGEFAEQRLRPCRHLSRPAQAPEKQSQDQELLHCRGATLGPASLVPPRRCGMIVAGALMLLILLGTLFWLDPRYCTWPGTSVSDIVAFERSTATIGTTAKGEYLPRTTESLPNTAAMTTLDTISLPPGTIFSQIENAPIGAELIITATQPFTATYNSLAYPGWQVSIDGADTPITPDTPYGRITFPIPEGRHRVSIRFRETPLRLAADLVSLIFLGLVSTLLVWPTRSGPSAGESISLERLSPAWIAWGLALLGLVLLVRHTYNPLRRPGLQADGSLDKVEHPMNQRYADGFALLGYNQDRDAMPTDDVLRLDLYLTTYARPTARYQSVVHLVGNDGLRWSLPDSSRPRGYEKYPDTTSWLPGQYALDSQQVIPLTGAPPGTYDIVLTIFNRDTLAPLSALNAEGNPAAPTLTLGQVTLTPPSHPTEPPTENRLDLPLGSLTLLAASFNRAQAAPGDPILFTSFWRAEEKPDGDIMCHLTLVAADGSIAAAYDLPPSAGWHPTSAWQPDDVWRGQHLIYLPAELESSVYTWTLRLPGTPSHPVGRLSITAPLHIFTPPAITHPLDVTLSETATLVGFDVSAEVIQPGDTLTLTLVWKAEITPTVSYHVFVHLVAPSGALVTQSDSIPAEWSRPTTGWLPGEYITDAHPLTIPSNALAGDHALVVGLYLPGGARLTTPDGSDAIRLTTVLIGEP